METFALQHKLPRAIGPSTTLYGYRDALLVKISTDSGLIGWAETADVGGTRGIIETHLKKVLLGKNPLEHRKLWRELWGANFGDGRAVAAVDIALHDVRGKNRIVALDRPDVVDAGNVGGRQRRDDAGRGPHAVEAEPQ